MEDQQDAPIDKSIKKDLKKLSDTKYTDLVQQIQAEYNIAYLHQYNKIQQQLLRLRLYNNQRRDPDIVGDTLMFSVHQTVLAKLYDDTLESEWQGYEEGDAGTADNLNYLAKYDYNKMQKDVLDYFWDWDALFFGRGLVMLQEFNRDPKFMLPIPELWDVMTFLRDPLGTSVKGDLKGRGGIRFGGREIYLNKNEIKESNGYMNFKYLRAEDEMRSLLKDAAEARDVAQNLQTNLNNNEIASKMGDNAMATGLQWITNWNGKRVMVVLAQKRTRLIKYVELGDNMPLIDRPMYPHSHDWAGTSIPDLTEDKQRQRSVAINLGLQAMKSDLYPHYLYDEDRIKNKGDLLKLGFNKFTGVSSNDGKDVSAAVRPLNKANIRMDFVDFILNTLSASSEKATATSDVQQGIQSQKDRPLGETNILVNRGDQRYSLTAKVFGWSERDFWQQWYFLYKEHFNSGIDGKVIRIAGSLGNKWRKLTRENIIAGTDPDVFIESKAVNDAKNVQERLLLQNYGNLLFLDPNLKANKRYFLKLLGKKNGLDRDEVLLLLPPTMEELKAEAENEALSEDKLMQVHPNDDHMAHLEIHQSAAETKAKSAHIFAHFQAMEIQRDNPALFPQAQPQPQPDPNVSTTPSQAMGVQGASATPSNPLGSLSALGQ